MLNAIKEIYQRLSDFRAKSINKELCDPFWDVINTIMEEETPRDVINRGMAMISKYGQWLFHYEIVTWQEMQEWFDDHTLMEHGIYINQDKVEVKDGRAIFYNSTGRITGHSFVSLFGESFAYAFDTSHINCYNKSKVVAKDASVTGFHESNCTVKGYGRMELWDDAKGTVSGYSMLMANDRSTFAINLTSFLVDNRK